MALFFKIFFNLTVQNKKTRNAKSHNRPVSPRGVACTHRNRRSTDGA